MLFVPKAAAAYDGNDLLKRSLAPVLHNSGEELRTRHLWRKVNIIKLCMVTAQKAPEKLSQSWNDEEDRRRRRKATKVVCAC